MKPRDGSTPSPQTTPTAPGVPATPQRSGRVNFDERGQAVWEWAVKTGMFDRNASTQRIKALVETPLELFRDEPPAKCAPARQSAPGGACNPYERAPPKKR